MKYIRMNTGREIYRLPLIIVATDRAEFYAGHDGFEKGSKEWKEEIDFIMEDDYEGIDWLMNNMNLSEVKPFMEKVEDSTQEDDEWFYDSDNFELTK